MNTNTFFSSRKDYPVMSKSIVRQRLITSHTHLAGKLSTGVLSGHPQVHSHYQYEGGVPLSGSDSQEQLSNPFSASRESSLLYHCFKHRGNKLKSVQIYIQQPDIILWLLLLLCWSSFCGQYWYLAIRNSILLWSKLFVGLYNTNQHLSPVYHCSFLWTSFAS